VDDESRDGSVHVEEVSRRTNEPVNVIHVTQDKEVNEGRGADEAMELLSIVLINSEIEVRERGGVGVAHGHAEDLEEDMNAESEVSIINREEENIKE
jgi:hypothetical protein